MSCHLVPGHDAICGDSEKAYKEGTTKRAEYLTRVNGVITTTANGESPLRFHSERGLGYIDIQIPFE